MKKIRIVKAHNPETNPNGGLFFIQRKRFGIWWPFPNKFLDWFRGDFMYRTHWYETEEEIHKMFQEEQKPKSELKFHVVWQNYTYGP